MLDDPLIANEVQPTNTVAELVRADERLRKEFPLITLPVLILHGTADKVTKPSGSQMFFDTAGPRQDAEAIRRARSRSAERFRKGNGDAGHSELDRQAPVVRKFFIALLLAAVVACGGRQPPGLVRLYVLDGGTLHVTDPSRFQLKKDEVAELNFSVGRRPGKRRKSSARRLRPSSIGSGTDR